MDFQESEVINIEYLLGIDVGTTNLKANLYDTKGKRVGGSSRPTRTHHPNPERPGWSVYDPDELWDNTVQVIREVVSKIRRPEMIKGLAITGMGEPGVPIDRDGNWLYPAITWFDRRTAPQAEWWKEQVGSYRVFAITGQPILFQASINMIMWLKENEPKVYQKMYRWLNIEDYLIFKISGNFATDYSIASRTMGFDVKNKCWSEELFQAADLDIEKMVPVHPSGTAVGKVSKEAACATALAQNTVVVTGGHDHGCATLAAKVFEEDSILNSTGTSDAIVGVINYPSLTDEICNAALSVYPHPVKGKYQVLTGLMFAGATLDWYVERFGYQEKMIVNKTKKGIHSLLLQEAERADLCSSGLFWLPHLRGIVTDIGSRGALVGIVESHKKSDVLRAIIEGICFEVRGIIENYESLLKFRADTIVVVGGTSQSDFWLQMRADITGRVIEIPDVVEATSLGAAILAGISVGIYKDHEEAAAQIYRIKKKFQPDPDRSEKYNYCYQKIYRKIYQSLKELNSTINQEFPMMR